MGKIAMHNTCWNYIIHLQDLRRGCIDDNLMADKGFNISDFLVSKGSRLIIPTCLRDKNRFSKKNCKATSYAAKARIHVERSLPE